MIGIRAALITLFLLYLSAIGTMAVVALDRLNITTGQALTELSQKMEAALTQADTPEQIEAAIEQQAKSLPLQYAHSIDRETVEQYTWGQFALPKHPMAWALDITPTPLTTEKKWRTTDIHLRLDGDFFLTQTLSPLYVPLVGYSLTWLLLSLFISRRGQGLKKDLSLLHAGIKRLPSFELPSQLNKVKGPLAPLSSSLFSSYEELKAKFIANGHHDPEQQVSPENKPDELTGLKSRARFNDELEQPVNDEAPRGYLILLRAHALTEVNKRFGQTGGDAYLNDLAERLAKAELNHKPNHAYRYGSADLLLRLPDHSKDETLTILKDLSIRLGDISTQYEIASAGVLAAVHYQQKEPVSTLLTNLDTAISIAESQGANSQYLMESKLSDFGIDVDHWSNVIQDVLDNGRIEFRQQVIRPVKHGTQLYTELLVQFRNAEDNPLPTETVFSMAAKHGKAILLDKLIITKLARELTTKSDARQAFGINLTRHAFTDLKFMAWLERLLQDNSQLSGRLVFEIDEQSIEVNPIQATDCFNRLHKLGARISIDRFGTALTAFRYFQMLKPDFIKLESALTHNIDKDANNRFFIKMLLDIAVRMDIKIIACHVEQADERAALETLKVDGLQGHLIAMPKPFAKIAA